MLLEDADPYSPQHAGNRHQYRTTNYIDHFHHPHQVWKEVTTIKCHRMYQV